MKIFDRLKAAYKALKIATNPEQLEEMIRGVYGGGPTESGESVTPTRAMQQAAVFTCVRVLGESVAQLPFNLYRSRDDGGSDKMTTHPLYRLLHYQPNEWQTSFEFREYLMACLNLRGNFYAFKNYVGSGRNRKIAELLPLHPDTVTVVQDEKRNILYEVQIPNAAKQTVPQKNMLHIKGLSLDGVAGVSPIRYQREAIGLAMAAEKHGARVFKNGARPSVILKHPGSLTDEAAQRLKNNWETAYGGENVGKTAVLENGMGVETISMTNEDAQYLETRKFQRSEIAGIYRVPAHLVNDLEKATFSNIEHQSVNFVVHSLNPWLVRIEQAIWRDLLTPEEQAEGYYTRFNVDGLLRGDSKSRAEALKIQRENGIINANEWRALENMNPIDGGDVYLTPLNMRQNGVDPNEED
jgi:HK97 family phage portal protein